MARSHKAAKIAKNKGKSEPSFWMSMGFTLAYWLVWAGIVAIIALGLELARTSGVDAATANLIGELYPWVLVLIFSVITAILGAKGARPKDTPYVFYVILFLLSVIATYFAGKWIARRVLRARRNTK